jgi:hypothetical protein
MTDAEKLQKIRALAESWHKGFGITPPATADDMEVAYDDAAYQLLHILNEETVDFYGRPWQP